MEEGKEVYELRYKGLFETFQDGILLLDETGIIKDVNPALTKILEYNKENLIGKKPWEINFFGEGNKCRKIFKELEEKGEIHYKELQIKTKKGKQIYIEFTGNLYISGDKKTVQCRIRDVTADKEIEEKLRESEEKFKKIFEHSVVGIAIVNIDGKFLHVNKALGKIMGYSENELLKKTYLQITHLEDVEKTKKAISKILSGKEDYESFEERCISKEGKVIWTALNIALIKYQDNKPKYFIFRIENINQRKEIEEKLRESEEKFRKIFEHSSIGISLVGIDGRWLQVNHALCRITGYSEKELLGKAYLQITHPEDVEKTKNLTMKLLSGKKEYGYLEKRYINKEGKIIWVTLSIAVIKDFHNKPAYFVVHTEDITKRKRAEEGIKESENKFSTAFYSSPNLMAITTPKEGRILEVNEAYYKFLGYQKKELIGHTTRELKIWTDPLQREGIIKKIKEFGKVNNVEVNLRKKSGEIGTVMLSFNQITLKNEPYLISVAADITERKKIESALKESEEKYRTVAEKANDGIVILQGFTVKYANSAMENIIGEKVKDVINKKFIGFIAKEEVPKILINYSRRISGGEVPLKYESLIMHKTGRKIPIEINATKIDYGGKPADLVIIRDITERKKYQERLEEEVKSRTEELVYSKVELEENVKRLKLSYEQLETLDKMKSDFINLTAHEIKTPITPILIQADSLQRGDLGKLNEKQSESVGVISRNIKRLNRLLEQILSLSRMKENITLIRIKGDINKIIKDSVEVMGPLAKEKGVEIRLNLREVPELKMDTEKINQVLINLIDNAIKFNNSKKPWVIINTKKVGGDVLVKITDNGIGIRKKDMNKLFKPFSQIGEIETKKKGTGLGLNISKTIINLHGGKMWAKSEFKKNTTFYFTLPIKQTQHLNYNKDNY